MLQILFMSRQATEQGLKVSNIKLNISLLSGINIFCVFDLKNGCFRL